MPGNTWLLCSDSPCMPDEPEKIDSEQLPWPWRGCPEHDAAAAESQEAWKWLGHINMGLDLIAHAIDLSATSLNEGGPTVNELSAVACYTRAFRAVRATTILAMSGLYLEARVHARDIYESAGLGRMLAREPGKADDWLSRERWVQDNEVRQYAQAFTAPGIPETESAYREYYQQASQLHHPTARGCLPLVLAGPNEPCEPRLASTYDADELENVLHAIALETLFVCFTIINAASNQALIDPSWRQAVTDLARATAEDADWSHLDRDQNADNELFERIRAEVIGAGELGDLLEQYPNSTRNVLRRSNERAAAPSGGAEDDGHGAT